MSTPSENTHPSLYLLICATHALHPQIAIATYKIIKNQADTAVVGHANTAWTTQATIMAILTEAFTSAANSNNITKWEPVLAALTNVSGMPEARLQSLVCNSNSITNLQCSSIATCSAP